MEQEYKIYGISRLIEKVGKQYLARKYNTNESADFKSIILNELKSLGVPNGLEIAQYFTKEELLSKKDEKKVIKEMEDTGKSYIGTSTIQGFSNIFFYIDIPIDTKELLGITLVQINTVSILNEQYIMRKTIL